jgi:hypothetical protein
MAKGLHLSSTSKELRSGSIWNELGTRGRKSLKFRKLSQISLYFEASLINLNSGQAELFCTECHKSGALSVNFEFRVRSVSPQELVQYMAAVARGEKPESLVTMSRYWVEALEPIVSVERYSLKIHSGLMVRYPGLVKKLDDKKQLGDMIFWDTEPPLFKVSFSPLLSIITKRANIACPDRSV